MEYRLDCLGRQKFVIQGTQSSGSPVRVTEFTYDADTLALTAEITVEGAFSATATTTQFTSSQTFKRTLDRHQDNLMRDAGWELKDGTTVENAVSYGRDAAGRVRHVDPVYPLSGSPAFTYSYVASSSSLIDSVVGPVHTVTNHWENDRDVLLDKINHLGTPANPVSKYDYAVSGASGDGANALGQRKNVVTTGSGFDASLASTSATGPAFTWSYNSRGEVEEASDTSAANQDRAYQYDAIGNRVKTANGLLADLPTSPNYTANALNQYTTADGVSLPVPAYDADGNYTHGPLPVATGNATLVWDAENRLVQVTRADSTVITYGYDHQSRRISKKVGSATAELYLYDGWNPIAKYTGTTLVESYTWGMDLSGTPQGAGGVGGLLRVTVHGSTSSDDFFPTYDGNGNVSEYLDASGAILAHYEYDAFGNTTIASGTKSGDFAHRFSTKPLDTETGLYYYGYRYYDPATGRWPSRDPIAESGGHNLFVFSNNNAIYLIDKLGLNANFGYTTQKLTLDNTLGYVDWVTQWNIAGFTPSTSEEDRSKLLNDPNAGYAIEGNIVQHVKTVGHVTSCKTGETTDLSNNYTEYWQVASNFGVLLFNPGSIDHFTVDARPCTKGNVIIRGSSTFAPGYEQPKDAAPGGNPQSGNVPSVNLFEPINGPTLNHVEKLLIVEWDWCDGDDDPSLYVKIF